MSRSWRGWCDVVAEKREADSREVVKHTEMNGQWSVRRLMWVDEWEWSELKNECCGKAERRRSYAHLTRKQRDERQTWTNLELCREYQTMRRDELLRCCDQWCQKQQRDQEGRDMILSVILLHLWDSRGHTVEPFQWNDACSRLSCSCCCRSSQNLSHHSYPALSPLAQNNQTHWVQTLTTYLQSVYNHPTLLSA